eukprot:CAMPEP_0180820864 /NCGR_PEP_ID=MMETSP1038_2-20121128/70519_1 /TAXON_ID=632150 /ORGANISM="Azadinium spinosum, Strain 3D9" /LENGTH=73 /DNA_ID=CAMNT_0022862997 /DNA_START=12 /DNA_END=233 /DNA_ORIENTATION=+
MSASEKSVSKKLPWMYWIWPRFPVSDASMEPDSARFTASRADATRSATISTPVAFKPSNHANATVLPVPLPKS